MLRISIEEAKEKFDDIAKAASKGETVLVVGGEYVLQITVVGAENKVPRKPGSAAGKILMSEDFDEPLDDFKEYM